MNALLSPQAVDIGEGDAGFILGSGEVAVLLIHGLTGTPSELRRVAMGLAAAGYTVYVPTLAGHCGNNADLQATRWHDWYESARNTYLGVRRKHERVFVGGLSMGAVLSMYLAAEHPGQIEGLLLYSTTLRYDGWNIPRTAVLIPWVMAIPFGVHLCRFNEKSPFGIKDERLRAIVERQMRAGESANAGLPGMSGVCVRELRRLVAALKKRMPHITTQALVVHSLEDDITSRWNADYVERKLGGPVVKVLLDDCYHMITVDLQYRRVVELSVDFIQQRFKQQSNIPQPMPQSYRQLA